MLSVVYRATLPIRIEFNYIFRPPERVTSEWLRWDFASNHRLIHMNQSALIPVTFCQLCKMLMAEREIENRARVFYRFSHSHADISTKNCLVLYSIHNRRCSAEQFNCNRALFILLLYVLQLSFFRSPFMRLF